MKNAILTAPVILASLFTSAAGAAVAREAPADLILRNGSVYLVEPEGKWAEAVAVRDGKIAAVGTNRQVDRLKGRATKIIDLKRRMVMPGIVDNHVHVAAAAFELQTYTCNFSAYGDLEALLASIRKCAAETKPGDWILGESWGSGLYGRLSDATALKMLDEASGDHPVLLRNDSIHDRWVNSKALALAGITKDTPDPKSGKIGRDPKTGELNGLMLERAGELVERVIPAMNAKPTVEAEADALAVGIRFLNSQGITGFNDAGVTHSPGTFSDVRAYRLLDKRGGLTAHVALSMLVDPDGPALDEIYADRAETNSALLNMNFAKIMVDGVMVSHTAEFIDPYLPDEAHGSDFRGMTKISGERLTQLVKELDRRGVSVKMHVAGDGAVRMALDAIAAARNANGTNGPIHTLAHAGYIADSDIARLPALNAAVDASPTVWYPGPILTGTEAVIGQKRANRFWPFKTFAENGVVVAGGTDWKTLPGEFSSLWDGMQGMVTRRNPRGAAPGALWPEQAIDVATMIRFYTINSARAMGADARIGSIKVGKDADLVVLDQNLFNISPDRIAATKVDMTLFGGKTVYERK
jgi:predicted amidohydrolase YtcJ